jgi:hypothetical protein
VDRNPYEEDLYKYINVEWADGPVPGSFFAADIFENFCLNLDDWASNDPGQLEYFGGKSLMTQSHGQSLMSFFTNRYRIKGLFLLDEPETAPIAQKPNPTPATAAPNEPKRTRPIHCGVPFPYPPGLPKRNHIQLRPGPHQTNPIRRHRLLPAV